MKRKIETRKERIQGRVAQVFDYLKIQPDEFPIVLEFIEIYKAQLKSKQIKELATENFKPVNITSEGEKRPYHITNGEVILTEQQMKEIWKNL